MRFFFDYVTQGEAIYDYVGGEFLSPHHAFDFAEATREDLKNSGNGDWRDWSVEVRNAEYTRFFSLPVGFGVPVKMTESAA
jgi:hypothetical protein